MPNVYADASVNVIGIDCGNRIKRTNESLTREYPTNLRRRD